MDIRHHVDPKVIKKLSRFAIEGMHLDDYVDQGILLDLYARYFVYDSLKKASHVYAAYEGDQLLGLLLADVKGAKKAGISPWQSAFVTCVDFALTHFFKDSADRYDQANQAMLAAYEKDYNPDGTIIFLATDPAIQGKGIGSRLLAAFEQEVPGQEIYLYTDDRCNVAFYEKKGFSPAGQTPLTLENAGKKIQMTAFLFHKQVPAPESSRH